MKNSIKKIAISLFALICMQTSAFASDFSEWAKNDIQTASSSNLLTYSVMANNLKENITRKEFCELIMTLYSHLTNENLIVPEGSPFPDVYDISVSRAYAYGIVSGDDNNNFNPQNPITREEAIKIIFNLLIAAEKDIEIIDDTDTSFKDLQNVSEWAKSSTNTILNENLIFGEDANLNPKSYLSREEAIALVNRISQKYNNIKNKELILSVGGYLDEDTNILKISWSDIPNASKYIVFIKDENGNLLKETITQDNWLDIENTFKNHSLLSITVGVIGPEINFYTMPTQIEIKNENESDIKRNQILETAKKYLGIPYVWGGTTPNGFDCSGLVQYVYAENGYNITRTTYTQWDYDGILIKDFNDLKVGDLVYFSGSSSPSHVGLYVGDGQMIHAPHTGDVVKYTSIVDTDYINRFMGAKRIIQD